MKEYMNKQTKGLKELLCFFSPSARNQSKEFTLAIEELYH